MTIDGRAGRQVRGGANIAQTGAPRPSKKDDGCAALADLPAGVKLGDPVVAQFKAFFSREAQRLANERAADAAAERRDLKALQDAIARVKLKTQWGEGLRGCLLRDLRGETLTIKQALNLLATQPSTELDVCGESQPIRERLVQAGWKPSPLLPPGPNRGKPVNVAVARTVREFGDVYGWSPRNCAAVAYLSCAMNVPYDKIKKVFADSARPGRRRAGARVIAHR
jgi:hypothetical protein